MKKNTTRQQSSPQSPELAQGPLTVGIDLASRPDAAGKRGMDALDLGFFERDVMFRAVGDTLALSPPLIVSESQIGEIFDKLGGIIKAVA